MLKSADQQKKTAPALSNVNLIKFNRKSCKQF